MEDKKKVTILVVIALILAITAITLTSMNSEISTKNPNQLSPTGAVVGIIIEPSEVEDKLAGPPQ